MKKLNIALLLLGLSLIGCGSDKKDSSNVNVDNQRIAKSEEELFQMLSDSTVICADKNDCPNNVAKLTFWVQVGSGKYGVGVCSGTLVEEGYLITNSHCVPDNLKSGNACGKQIVIEFPETNTLKKERIKCEKVVQVYNRNNKEDGPDLAVLKVSNSIENRNTSVLKPGNFVDQSDVYAYTMNPSSYFKDIGTITKKECKISNDNIFTFKANAESAMTLIHGDKCKIIGGNSGSGLFDSEGNYIGAIFARLDLPEVKKLLASSLLFHEPLTNMGLAYNINCIRSLYVPGQSCETDTLLAKSIDEYLDLKKLEFGLESVEEDNIKVTINEFLGIELEQTDRTFFYRMLDSVRKKLNEAFKDSSQKRLSRKFSKLIK